MQGSFDFSGSKYIDAKYLQELSNGDSSFIIMMLNTFLEQSPQNILAIKNAVAQKNKAEVYNEAHNAKSTYGYLGLQNVIDVLLKIENASKDITQENLLESLLVELILQHQLCIVEAENMIEKNRNRLQF